MVPLPSDGRPGAKVRNGARRSGMPRRIAGSWGIPRSEGARKRSPLGPDVLGSEAHTSVVPSDDALSLHVGVVKSSVRFSDLWFHEVTLGVPTDG
jgi:hypothetical protein